MENMSHIIFVKIISILLLLNLVYHPNHIIFNIVLVQSKKLLIQPLKNKLPECSIIPE